MMGTTLCPDQQHKFHHYLTKKSLREIDIPPRKLLSRRAAVSDVYMDSPKAEDAVFSKFLPYNNVEDDDSDPYSSDHFRMYEFKVRKCNRSRSHDWTDCPFAHPGEKARRRDPRRYHYSGTVCSEFRKGNCSKGDNCEFSHGVFECWLHPTRYRTEACKDGKNCKRKVCFFAHSTRQLRILPEPTSPPAMDSPATDKRYRNLNNCCVFCHSITQSPTSTLMGVSHVSSPPTSPPVSPVCSPPEYSIYGDRFGGIESYRDKLSYKDAVTELMASFDAMNVKDVASGNRNLPWLDVNNNFSVDEQPQFVLSPSTPNPSPSFSRGSGISKFSSGESNFSRGDFSGRNLMEDRRYNNETNNLAGPDLGWVNDLLT